MTTYRPNHDDPAPGRGADALADALDALLNGIAQGMGSPASRTGRGSAGPDARTDRNDAIDDDLLRDARAFHRRFAAAEARIPGAATPSPHLWEQIMASTASPSPVARTTGGTVTAQPSSRNGAKPTRHHRPRLLSHSWQAFGNATLALFVILAAFGVWRVYDGMNGTGTPIPESTVPGLAMLPGTPDPGADTVTAPAATPTPAYACDFSQDIPIIEQVATVPVQGTVLRLTPSDELVLTCPEEPGGIVLAAGITQVSPMFWPGTVHLFGEGNPGERPVSVLNVFTGQTLDLGPPPAATTYQWMQPADTPWFISSMSDTPGDWTIVDLRTMESRSYTELSGATPLPDGTVLDAGSNGSMLVISSWFSTYPANAGTDASHPLLDEPAALIIEGSLNDTRMISLPGDLAPITETQLAPDGQHLALKATEDSATGVGTTTYSIVRTSDGSEVARSETFSDPATDMRWVQEGKALAYTQVSSLHVLSTDPDQVPTTMLERTSDTLSDLRTTYDPNVVLVTRVGPNDPATEASLGIAQRVFSVNTATGDVIEIEGVDVSTVSRWDADTRFLVMGDTEIMSMDAETASFRVVDAVSGEILGELSDIHISQNPNGPAMELRTVASTPDGNVEVIGFNASQIFLLQMTDGDPEIRHLPAPNAGIASYVDSAPIWLSNDGTQLSLTIDSDESGNRYLLDLTNPDAEWVAIPTPDDAIAPGYGTAPIQFMPGTGD